MQANPELNSGQSHQFPVSIIVVTVDYFMCQNMKLGQIFGGNLVVCEFSKHGVLVIYFYVTYYHKFSILL